MANQKIRIRLKGYDHEIVDQSTKLIVDTAQKTGGIQGCRFHGIQGRYEEGRSGHPRACHGRRDRDS